jgi:hypothetical protein
VPSPAIVPAPRRVARPSALQSAWLPCWSAAAPATRRPRRASHHAESTTIAADPAEVRCHAVGAHTHLPFFRLLRLTPPHPPTHPLYRAAQVAAGCRTRAASRTPWRKSGRS